MDIAQTFALMFAGSVAVPLLQALKRLLGWSGPVMLWLSFGVSLVIAVIALLIFGQVTLAGLIGNPQIVFAGTGVVMTVAQLVYGTIKDKL
jgi:hypothetical protein